jgi:conjugative transfer signal peptidase TraF
MTFGIRKAAAIVVAIVTLAPPIAANVTINTTASLPRGAWINTGDLSPARAGDVVLICPPADAQTRRYVGAGYCPGRLLPLLKPVAAVAGDLVRTGPSGITVNGRTIPNSAPMAQDGSNRPLTAYPFGTYRVRPGMVWLISSYNSKSFDSRYFGPLDAGGVERKERPLLTIP